MWAEHFARFLERWKAPLLAIFTVIYFAGTALRASAKPFEHDELYTLFLSRLDFRDLWRALSTGADASPPLSYLLVRAAHACFGSGEVAIRIPAMIGFWLFCLCLFRFARRRAGILLAFTAMLLPFATGAYHFAFEARCYGQLLGFTGCALVFWQMAAEHRHRRLALIALALSLAATTFSHYYGIILYMPLAGGELWREFQRRRVDAPVWAAFAAGLVPLVACYPLMASLTKYSHHPWAYPHLGDLTAFYERELQHLILPALAFLILAALYVAFCRPGRQRTAQPESAPAHEVIALILLSLLPVACIAGAFTVTGMFTDRYVIAAVGGIVLLAVFVIARLAGGNPAVGAIALLAASSALGIELVHQQRFQNPIDTAPLLRAAIERGPVAIDDGLLFFQAWYYLPPEQRSRVYYVDDPESAVTYTGTDTIDLNFRSLQPWTGISLADYARVAAPGAKLLVYHTASRPVWLVQRLLKDGAQIQVERAQTDRTILSAVITR